MTKQDLGLLTPRQLEILKIASEGFTQADIAEKLHTSRQNVYVLITRARRNIAKAQRTILLIQNLGIAVRVRIPKDTHILDAAKEVIFKADKERIRIKDDALSITAFLRSRARGNMESGRFTKDLDLIIMPNGEIMLA